MIRNYIKIAFRNFAPQGTLATINLVGLSIGLTVSFYLFIYAWQQFSFDKFHSQCQNIYRVLLEINHLTGTYYSNQITTEQSESLDQSLPFLTVSTDIFKQSEAIVQINSESFYDEHFYLTDSNFLEIFDFELASGNKSNVLKSAASIILNERIAEKYFGNTQVLGKEITINNEAYYIEGVLKNSNENSHLNINFLGAITPQIIASKSNSSWLSKYFISNTDQVHQINEGINDLIASDRNTYNYYVQNLEDIHLYTNPQLHDYTEHSDARSVYIVITIALLILATATFNFMNLLLASYLKRLKELSIRKIQGAGKVQVITQLFFEAFIWTTISILLAGLLLEIGTPIFNNFLSYEVSFEYTSLRVISFFGFFLIMLPAFGAFYPSMYAISVSNAQLISKTESATISKYKITRSLVVLQCFVAILLLVGSGIVRKQTNYLAKKDLGIKANGILTIDLENKMSIAEYQLFSQQLSMLPEVKHLAAGPLPGRTHQLPIKSKSGVNHDINIAYVMGDFLSLLEVNLADGKNIDPANWKDKVLINIAALNSLELDGNGIGQNINYGELNLKTYQIEPKTLEVVGLIEDYHFENLKNTIAPLIIEVSESKGLNKQFGIRFETTDLQEFIQTVKKHWKTIKPYSPFSFALLDDKYENFQSQERQLADGLGYVTGLSILLSLIGLFSLSQLELQGRFKEISIKKVLGASSGLLAKQYLTKYLGMVWLASILGVPLGYYFANDWLRSFSYKVTLEALTFASPILIISIISGLCVFTNIWKATSTNPVENLRKES